MNEKIGNKKETQGKVVTGLLYWDRWGWLDDRRLNDKVRTDKRTNEINRYDYARCLISLWLLVALHVDE